MDEYDDLQRIAAEIDAKMAAGQIDAGQYDLMHRYGRAIDAFQARMSHVVAEQEQRVENLQERMTDMEAASFANKCEQEMDLERWKDGIAARVGQDVEEVADRLMDAMLAYGRGEDIDRALWDIHGDMLCIVADLSTMDQDKEA